MTGATASTRSEQPKPGLTARVLRGSSYATLGQAAVLGTALFATPFTVRILGPERYGVLSLVLLLIGYALLADLGMGATSTRFAAEAIGQANRRKEVAVVWTSLLVASVPSLLGMLTLFGASRQIVVTLLRLNPAVQGEAIAALRWATVVFLLKTASGIFNTPPVSHLRLGTYTLITSGAAVLQSALTPMVLKLGGDVATVLEMAAGINIAALIALILVDFRILPEIRRPRIDRALVRPMAIYGGGLVANAIAEVLFAHFDKLAVTRYVSVRELGFYAIAAAIAGMIAPIPLALYQTLLPAFTQMEAAGDTIGCELLLQRATKAVFLLALPLLMVVLIATHPFLTIWAGPEFALRASRTAYVLAAGQVISIFGYAPSAVLCAKGRSGLMATLRWCELPVYLAVVVLLARYFGPLGAAAGWSVRYAIDTALVGALALSTMRPRAQSPMSFSWVAGALMCLVVSAPLFAKLLHGAVALQFAVAAPALAAYVLIGWKSFLRDEEREWLLRFVRRTDSAKTDE